MASRRIGGRGVTGSGGALTWSVADGVRGTRWREALEVDGRLSRTVLLEVAPTGRPTRLEIATAAGLLTLHPEPDESAMHGNVVGDQGVRHLAQPWGPDDELWVDGSVSVAAVALGRLAGALVVGASAVIGVLWIDDRLEPREERLTIERRADRSWRVAPASSGAAIDVELDEVGVVVLADAVSWSLER